MEPAASDFVNFSRLSRLLLIDSYLPKTLGENSLVATESSAFPRSAAAYVVHNRIWEFESVAIYSISIHSIS